MGMMKEIDARLHELERENAYLKQLLRTNVDAYTARIGAERDRYRQHRHNVQRCAQRACHYLDLGHQHVARELLRPLESGDYGNEQNTTGKTTGDADTA